MNRIKAWMGPLQGQASSLLQEDSNNIDVARAQYQSVRRQASMLYIMSLLCGWGLVSTFWSVAPAWATLIYPIAITCLFALRVAKLQLNKDIPDSLKELEAWKRNTRVIAVIAPTLFAGWSFMLFPYGTPLLQAQVAFTVVVMNLVALFCLIHLRSAAILIVLSSTILYLGFFLWRGESEFAFLAMFGVLVSVVAFFILNNHYRDFISLVNAGKTLKQQKRDLQQKQDETQRLSDLNYQFANHDNLTGLPNRRCFFNHLDECFAASRVGKRQYGLCVF